VDDRTLIAQFEATTLPAEDFPHAAHVRAAWHYLTHYPLLEALARFKAALIRFATAKGRPDRYHETITIAYMLLIAERRAGREGESWAQFAERNDDLLRWQPSILSRYYTAETLQSERARQHFVLPENAPA
jgi:hypothetical protein